MPTDIDISRQSVLRPITEVAKELGLLESELIPYGLTKAKVSPNCQKRLEYRASGKLVVVTAITPTPFGEGKTVTTIGLAQGLAKIGKRSAACIRQPSMGPVFGIKGGAAGGGQSQVVPMEELNLHLTGDIHAVTSAHNLAAAALDARIHHEQRLGYENFHHRTGLHPLRIDPENVVWRRVTDHNDRSLRMVTVGNNTPGKNVNGFQREDGFDISASSELMAILALSSDIQDLRSRIGRIVLAYNHDGDPVTAEDLKVAGAMTVTLRDAAQPTLMQTLEGVPALIHTGPFANIAHGNSSVIADNIALKLSDFTVTEAGFGSDMGFEKACNIKASASEKSPDCAVIVTTLRGLKANSGLYKLIPGAPLPKEITEESQEALNLGFKNLVWHIKNVSRYGVPVVVAINRFPDDSEKELGLLTERVRSLGDNISVEISEAHQQGGEGCIRLARAVAGACEQAAEFRPLYSPESPLEDKILTLCEAGYGARNTTLSEKAKEQLDKLKKQGYDKLHICMAKTPLSISTDPGIKGVPEDFEVNIRELKLCAGAGFVYALCGNVMTMPGLPDRPAYMEMDIDENGEIVGLS